VFSTSVAEQEYGLVVPSAYEINAKQEALNVGEWFVNAGLIVTEIV
jgi:predicted AlkP superfamily phosphohydrolase/phosphomutase